jgi:hypothetical protein
MLNNVLAFQQQFQEITCYKCAVLFAVPAYFKTKRLEDHETFWCPNGHSQAFTGKSEAEKLREQLEREQRALGFAREREAALRQQRDTLEHRLNGTKGALTKIKKRVAGGCCPCCKRSFTDLRRHMTTKHPDFGPTDREEK